MTSALFYPIQVYVGNPNLSPTTQLVTTIFQLPEMGTSNQCIILVNATGQGLYIWTNNEWNLLLNQTDVAAAAIFGYSIQVYVNATTTPTFVNGAVIYQNGINTEGSFTPGPGIYCITNALRFNYVQVDPGNITNLAIRFQGAENTGIYLDNSGNMIFVINGVEVMRLTSSGMIVQGNVSATGFIEGGS